MRKPSIATLIKRAEKAGKTVTSVTTPDGTVLHFGEPATHRGEQSVARRSQGDEAMKLPKYVQHWVDHDGRAHCYFRRRGYPRVRLPGLPWSPSFMAAYEAALTGPRTAIGAGRIKPGSVAAVVAEYFDSQQFFASKSAGTQRMRRGILERFRAAYGDRPFALLPPEWIEALLDAKPPHAARSWLVTLRSLCQFAVKRGWLRADPTRDIKQRSIKGDGFHTWTDDEIAQFEAHHPDRHQAAPRAGIAALHRATALRCRPHGPPAHQGRRADGETAKDRRHVGDPGASRIAGGARRHAERTPDVPGHRDRQAIWRQRVQRAVSKLVRRGRIAEALLARTGCARRHAAGSPKPDAAPTRSWRSADTRR